MNEQIVIASVKSWIEKTVIGFNFCPFAKREYENARIHFECVDDPNQAEQLHALANEFQRLDEDNNISTTILILSVGLESFFDYLDMLVIANDLLAELKYEGTYQLASFHPDYCFEGSAHEDAANYTNRSPYPLIHILRESNVEDAIRSHPAAENIPEENIMLAREKGAEVFEAILGLNKPQH